MNNSKIAISKTRYVELGNGLFLAQKNTISHLQNEETICKKR